MAVQSSITTQTAIAGRLDDSRTATPSAAPSRAAVAALRAAAAFWFVVTVLGQLAMAAYVVGFYGRAAMKGEFETWNKVLPKGYTAGDTLGNLNLSLHLVFVVVIVISGALQLTPAVRRLWPRFHHWNGRLYLASALLMSLGGLYMVWTRNTGGDVLQHLSTSINALLIIGFGVMAVREAMARRLDRHRRWALRFFLAVSGVWFFRVGLMFWILVNQGPVGFDPQTFRGPALTIIAFGQYLFPLALLELYFRVQRAGSRQHFAMAGGLVAMTAVTAVGVFGASMIMWLPRL